MCLCSLLHGICINTLNIECGPCRELFCWLLITDIDGISKTDMLQG